MTDILVVDYSSEQNRGDAAMQAGLLDLIIQHFQHAKISIISVFGANQKEKLITEYDHSCKYPVTILGGLRPTFYPLGNFKNNSILGVEIKNALFFPMNLIMLFLLNLKISPKWIGKVLPKTFRETLYQIEKSDLVIWKGRNFRSRGNPFIELYRTINLVFHPLVCIALSKPIACVGASVWHLKNPLAQKILRNVFQSCFYISAREKSSYTELKSLLGETSKTNVELVPDLSFALANQGKKIKENRASFAKTSYPNTIGLTIVDWKDEGIAIRENYKDVISRTIEHFLSLGSKIVIIPQVTKKWEANDLMISEIIHCQHNRENISIIPGNPSVSELLTIYGSLDFLIATRMHSAIFATFVGTPLVAIPYDKGGKWNILRDLGYKDHLINYADLSLPDLLGKIEGCWKNKNQILKEVESNIALSIEQVNRNIIEIKEYASMKGLIGSEI